MSFLFGGPYSSQVGQQIARATDNASSAGDLQLHLDICDTINETDSGPKEAIAALRKRITTNLKNFHVINLCLTVLESAVKNCGIRFHTRLAQPEFLQDLMKIVNAKNNPPSNVKERVYGLIQQWADAFKANPQLSAVVKLYKQLKEEGVEFPAQDLDCLAPINTPDRLTREPSGNTSTLQLTSSMPPAQQAPPPEAPRPQGNRGDGSELTGTQQAKLLSEIDVVQRNMEVMKEILVENEPGKEQADILALLEEVYNVTHKMQERVAELLGRIQNSSLMVTLLTLNDELNSSFLQYDRYMKNRSAVLQGTASTDQKPTEVTPILDMPQPTDPQTSTATSVTYPSLEDEPPPYEPEQPSGPVDALIDLSADTTNAPVTMPTVPTATSTASDLSTQLASLGLDQPLPSATTNGGTVDEFDIFAQSRQAYSDTSGSTYEDNRATMDVNLADAVQGKPMQAATDQTLANLDEWLNITDLNIPPADTTNTNVPSSTREESATSAEFDQFLAQRIDVGSSLPPARTRPQMQKAEEKNEELFAL